MIPIDLARAVLLLLCCARSLTAQWSAPKPLYIRSYGGAGEETGNAIAELAGGGYLVAGYSTVGNIDHEYLVCVDSAGKALWTRTSGNDSEDPAWDLATLRDGSLMMLGYTTGHGAQDEDALLSALDPRGGLRWRRTVGGPGDQLAWGMTTLTNGDLAIAGQTRLRADQSWNGWIARVGSDGSVRWAHTIERDGETRLFSVAAADGGGMILAGTRRTTTGLRHAWVVAVDSAGSVLWEREFGGELSQVGHQILRDGSNYLLTGYGEERDAADPSPAIAGPHREQPILLSLSTRGDSLWASRAVGSADERAIYSIRSKRGEYLSVGYRRIRTEEDWDMILSATALGGERQWDQRFPSPLPDRGVSLLETRDGSILLTGSRNNGPGHGNDLVLIKLGGQP